METRSKQLHSGSLYWPHTISKVPSYPTLNKRISTQVAIIGGGMTGALCAAVLAKTGISTVLVEGGKVASASTAANTGLLQFSNDIMLYELAEQIGELKAVQFYKECQRALKALAELASSIPFDTGFHVRKSLYYANDVIDAAKLYKEYMLLSKYAFPVGWDLPEALARRIPFRKEAALVTRGDAEINPVRFAHGLIAQAAWNQVRVFEHTRVQEIQRKNGAFIIHTESGEISAHYIVRASGYLPGINNPSRIKPILQRSYAMTTAANAVPESWPGDYMMWETARPYFYFRTTPDGRVIAGGLDEERQDPVTAEHELKVRTDLLITELQKLFPDSRFEAEYAWCGTFGESEDGLPYLGEDVEQPGIFHALGCGGNGTVYGMIAAEMLKDYVNGRKHPLTSLLAPGRSAAEQISIII
ncbi:NAD(P)/FAD-dependent oxidoreductase [Paenibacillus abyssi]|uniref:Oxidoreductase n=1 Tax=Paenibacillus abyssi TaxID=1340531 RepID=A0A917LCZ4_9BACL|nr:FAD-dependent oxidoreductase [Paenibacillus abyssi]GGG14198.1 oxidoreductase [Paenibacillus abyssi]